MKRVPPLPLVLAALAAPSQAGHVIVVGPGAQQVAEIQAAVDAALDDDVILVKTGTYQSFVVRNKSLTIVADTGQVVNVQGGIRARGLTVDRTLVLSGLRATGQVTSNEFEGAGLYLKDCAGFVRVQDCVLTAWSSLAGSCSTAARPGAEVEGCAAVSFVRCTLRGTTLSGLTGTWSSPPGPEEGHGLAATASTVAVQDCTLRGGSAVITCLGPYAGCDGGSGGHGIWAVGSVLYVSGTDSSGGDGASAASIPYCYGGSGGSGIAMGWQSGAFTRALACSLVGGVGGQSTCGFTGVCDDGHDGCTVCPSTPGYYLPIPGTPRWLLGSTVVRDTGSLTVSAASSFVDRVVLVVSAEPAHTYDPPRLSVQHSSFASRHRVIQMGTGTLVSVSVPVRDLPASSPGTRLFLQSLHVDAGGQAWWSTPLTVAVIDAAY